MGTILDVTMGLDGGAVQCLTVLVSAATIPGSKASSQDALVVSLWRFLCGSHASFLDFSAEVEALFHPFHCSASDFDG